MWYGSGNMHSEVKKKREKQEDICVVWLVKYKQGSTEILERSWGRVNRGVTEKKKKCMREE